MVAVSLKKCRLLCAWCARDLVATCVQVHIFSAVFFQAEDGIRDVERSRGLGDVYKRQALIPQFLQQPVAEAGASAI